MSNSAYGKALAVDWRPARLVQDVATKSQKSNKLYTAEQRDAKTYPKLFNFYLD